MNEKATVRASATCYVLVVDDDASIRESIEDVLADSGYKVRSAGNGREGLAMIRDRQPPCLILLDLMMPVMNGWEFCEELAKTEFANLPLFIITAGKLGNAPVPRDRILTKPIALERLIEVVQRYCSESVRT